MAKIDCGYCDKEIYIKPSRVRSGGKNYCNRVCKGLGQRGKPNNSSTKFTKGANMGTSHPRWKGDSITYEGIHSFIKRRFGVASKCENPECVYPRLDSRRRLMEKPRGFDWANVSGLYKRERSDWWPLCKSCHKKYDLRKKGQIKNRFLKVRQRAKI